MPMNIVYGAPVDVLAAVERGLQPVHFALVPAEPKQTLYQHPYTESNHNLKGIKRVDKL